MVPHSVSRFRVQGGATLPGQVNLVLLGPEWWRRHLNNQPKRNMNSNELKNRTRKGLEQVANRLARVVAFASPTVTVAAHDKFPLTGFCYSEGPLRHAVTLRPLGGGKVTFTNGEHVMYDDDEELAIAVYRASRREKVSK